jgi:hypothetical protein
MIEQPAANQGIDVNCGEVFYRALLGVRSPTPAAYAAHETLSPAWPSSWDTLNPKSHRYGAVQKHVFLGTATISKLGTQNQVLAPGQEMGFLGKRKRGSLVRRRSWQLRASTDPGTGR